MKTVNFIPNNLQNKIYELECSPTESINVHLQGVYSKINSNNYLIINFLNETEDLIIVDLDNKNNTDNKNIFNNISNNKSSSRKLSSRTIAVIVIARVIGLLAITTILYCLSKRSTKPSLQDLKDSQ